jgi:hypothetical protein
LSCRLLHLIQLMNAGSCGGENSEEYRRPAPVTW